MDSKSTLAILALVLLVLSRPGFANTVVKWNENQITRYQKRRFVELAHDLNLSNKPIQAAMILKQQSDLAGCGAFKKGRGRMGSMVKCMAFISREKDLGFKMESSDAVTVDLGRACRVFALNRDNAFKLLESRVLAKAQPGWRVCAEKVWEQVYLTAAANFEADPVATLAFVRKAQAGLPLNSTWARRTEALLQK
jgi:hypothetical protein